MKKLLFSFAFFSLSFTLISQINSYDRYWYFAPTTGFDWVSGSPVIVGTSSANQTEGCVTHNDVNGNLLFYGGDSRIYDATHATMQNGTGILSQTPKQGPISIQDPANLNEYYYIHPGANGGPLYYSKIDMTANSGQGAVINAEKNIQWRPAMGEGILGLRKSNTCNEFWILTHGVGNNDFYVDELDATGYTQNTAQSVGPSSNSNGSYMDYAPATGKLAMLYGTEDVAIFDFDDNTGTVSNFVNVPLYNVPFALEYYSLAFSPDGTKLYIGGGYGQNWLLQVDISNSNFLTPIDTGNGTGGNTLKLGPDGKIYGQALYTTWTGIINDPNQAGTSCNWAPNQINTGVTYSDQGFPSIGLGVLPGPIVTLGNDTTICSGETIPLDAGNATSYLWSTGDTTQTISADMETTYWVQVTDSNGCTSSDSINVFIDTVEVTITGNTVVCSGDTLTLVATSGYSSYQWSNNATSDSIEVSPSSQTTYYVTATEGQCSDIDTFVVNVGQPPTASVTGNSVVCAGQATTLTATGGGSYNWSTSDTSASISVNPNSGETYYVTITNACGTDVDSISVSVANGPSADAGENITISLGNNAELIGSGGGSYLWEPASTLSCNDCKNPIASPTETTTYYMTVTDENGCAAIDSVTVFVDNSESIFLPNIFSPNNDGANDVLFVRGKGIAEMNLKVFDRWGQLVFETNSQTNGWDGNYKGKGANPGVFAYTLKATLVSGNSIDEKGNITLIR